MNYLYVRRGVHDEGAQDIDNFVQFIPDICFFHQRQYLLHECAVQHPYFLALLHQLHDHLGLLAGRWPHLLGQVGDSLEVVAVGAVDECCEDVGKEGGDPRAALQ